MTRQASSPHNVSNSFEKSRTRLTSFVTMRFSSLCRAADLVQLKTAREQGLAVEDGELVVHVMAGLIQPGGDARHLQLVDIRAHVLSLLTVGDDADIGAALVGIDDSARDLVVCDGENADVDMRMRFVEQFP